MDQMSENFPLSMKVAYAKDLLVAKVAETPIEAVAIVDGLIKGFAGLNSQAPAPVAKIPGSGPYKPPPKAALPPARPVEPESPNGDLKSDTVTVLGWAKEPKTGKTGNNSWWKLGFKVRFASTGVEEWLNVWSSHKAELLKVKNQDFPITYSTGEYAGKIQYTLENIEGVEEAA